MMLSLSLPFPLQTLLLPCPTPIRPCSCRTPVPVHPSLSAFIIIITLRAAFYFRRELPYRQMPWSRVPLYLNTSKQITGTNHFADRSTKAQPAAETKARKQIQNKARFFFAREVIRTYKPLKKLFRQLLLLLELE